MIVDSIINKARIFILAPVLFLSLSLAAQNAAVPIDAKVQSVKSEIWEPAMVNVAGGNYVDGVDVYFKRTHCGTTEEILLKFVNNNDRDVLIEWADGIYTVNKNWVQNERNDKMREINLKGKQEIEGTCDGNSPDNLKIKLDQYLNDPEVSFRYAPSFIDITK